MEESYAQRLRRLAEIRVIKRLARLSGKPIDELIKQRWGEKYLKESHRENRDDKDLRIDVETVANEVIKILSKRGIDWEKILQLQSAETPSKEGIPAKRKRLPITDIQSVIDRITRDFGLR